MKKIFWTSVFWIALIILFRAYVRLFNPELGAKLSYCFMGKPEVDIKTETVDYSADITTINNQLLDINNKVNNILQTLGTDTPSQVTPTTSDTEVPFNAFNPPLQQ